MLWLLHAGLCIAVTACGSKSSSIQTGSAILRVSQTELASRRASPLARQFNHSFVDQTLDNRRRYATVQTLGLKHACNFDFQYFNSIQFNQSINLHFVYLTSCTWWVDSLDECSQKLHTTDHHLDISNLATCLYSLRIHAVVRPSLLNRQSQN
jgi:hypothetical protein